MNPAFRLAVRDLLREPLHVVGVIALIAGALAPLMLLFSIKAGVMDALIGSLRDNPEMRRISIIGNHNFSAEQLADLRGWPEIVFVAPQERSIARRLEGRPPGGGNFERITLVGSDAGDPLMPRGVTLGPLQIAPSASLAARFGLSPGDVLDVRAVRGNPPTARLAARLKVVAPLPRGWLNGSAALIQSGFAREVEAFYDGYALPAHDVAAGLDLAERSVNFESFRIYADDIGNVAALEAQIEASLGVTVNSRAAEIAPLLGLDRDVGAALNVLSSCAALGLAAALATLFWSNVERKRVTLSILALMGTPPRGLALFTLTQAALYALGGWLVAAAIFLLGAGALDLLFSGYLAATGPVAPVRAGMLLAIGGGLVALALIAGGGAARCAAVVDPAIAIRSGG